VQADYHSTFFGVSAICGAYTIMAGRFWKLETIFLKAKWVLTRLAELRRPTPQSLFQFCIHDSRTMDVWAHEGVSNWEQFSYFRKHFQPWTAMGWGFRALHSLFSPISLFLTLVVFISTTWLFQWSANTSVFIYGTKGLKNVGGWQEWLVSLVPCWSGVDSSETYTQNGHHICNAFEAIKYPTSQFPIA